MPDDALAERLAAVERALGEDGAACADPAFDADCADRLEDLEDDVDELEAEVGELQAAVQAVRGYVGSVRAVNDEVEQRADAAMAKAEAVEQALAHDRTEDEAERGWPTEPANEPESVRRHRQPPDDRCPRCGASAGHPDRPGEDPDGEGPAALGHGEVAEDPHCDPAAAGESADGEGLLAALREAL